MADDTLASEIGKALAKYGDTAVLAAWQHFTIPFLPVAHAIAQFRDLIKLAEANKLTYPEDVVEAIALLGSLRASEDPHRAWMAAEIIARNTRSPDFCIAALRGQPKDERPN